MFRNWAIKAALAVLASAGMVFGAVGFAATDGLTTADPFTVNYFLNAQTRGPDDTLRIVDPEDWDIAPPVCANIYVFDARQELEECCACPITPAGRLDFSLNNNLTATPLFSPSLVLQTGTIKVVSTNINPNGFTPGGIAAGALICDATNGTSLGTPPNPINAVFVPTSELFSWLTHDLNRFATGGTAVAEAEFQSTGEPASDLTTLQHKCGVTQFDGLLSGLGKCTCPAGPMP